MRSERTRRAARPATGRLAVAVLGCVLAGAAAMAGCSASATGAGSSGSGNGSGDGAALPQSKNAHATGDLTVWIRGSGDSPKAYRRIFAAFTAQSGIKVDIATATLTDFETKLTAAATAHRLPDVVIDDAAQLGDFESQGILLPVDRSRFAGADQLTDLAWKSATDLRGQTYAVPFSAQANVLLVRKDWLDRLGLQPPRTWDELQKVAKAFTTSSTYGLAVPGSTARGYAAWYWSSYLYQAGGDFVRPAGGGKYAANLDTAQALQAAQFLESQVCTAKDVQPSVLGDDTTAANKAFQTGVAGLYLTGPYAYATMDATAVKGKYIVIAPPAGPSGTEATLAEGTDIYTMADAKSDEATELEEFMVTPAAQKLGMIGVNTATVVRLSVNKDVDAAAVHGDDPRWALAQQVYQQAGHYEWDNLPNWTELRQKAANELNSLLSSCGSAQSALTALNGDLNSLLKQQGVG